jgi:hypothetical protein
MCRVAAIDENRYSSQKTVFLPKTHQNQPKNAPFGEFLIWSGLAVFAKNRGAL